MKLPDLSSVRAFPVLFVINLLAGCASTGGTSSRDRYDPAEFSGYELAPEVRSILEGKDSRARMTLYYLRYSQALLAGGDALDAVVAPDVQLDDLGRLGFKGLAGLKEFRRQRNAAHHYDRFLITAMRFPAADISEAEVCTERTDVATGAKVVIVIHAHNQWRDGMLIERADRTESLPPERGCGPKEVR
jgi:hypothetical protein